MSESVGNIELLGQGLYTPSEAARLVGISPSTARRWVSGYQFRYGTTQGRKSGASSPVIAAELPIIAERKMLSFVELVELLVVKAFLDKGLPMRVLRRVARHAAERLNTSHPFACQKFRTDGQEIYLEVLKAGYGLELIGLSQSQYAFHPILDPYLEKLDFDIETLMAIKWWPLGKKIAIVLDPAVSFGAPTIAGTRVPVSVVVDACKAGESLKAICDWYNLRLGDVKAALAWQRRKEAA